MAEVVILPKLGNSVESCILLGWKVSVGDPVSVGTVLCEAETDKTTVEVESTAEGILLEVLFQEDDEVEVFAPIAIVGGSGEDISGILAEVGSSPGEAKGESDSAITTPVQTTSAKSESTPATATTKGSTESTMEHTMPVGQSAGSSFVSPRAREAAAKRGIPAESLRGSGPYGRVIERDVLAYANSHEPLTPAAREQLGGNLPPAVGSGVGGRVTAQDIRGVVEVTTQTTTGVGVQEVLEDRRIPVKGVRKVIAQRMHNSIATTAQLTLNAYADVSYIKRFRERCKSLPDTHPFRGISINDMILYAVTKTLQSHPSLNAHFLGTEIVEYGQVHLGCAVDTPKGLMVPVIKNAQDLNLTELSQRIKTLAMGCKEGNITPDDLQGGTFTVSNLGFFGIEHFTPVLNVPEVGILGVGTISLHPVQRGTKIVHLPRIALSLTIDHQAVDGAPGARFLKDLSDNIKNFDLLCIR